MCPKKWEKDIFKSTKNKQTEKVNKKPVACHETVNF